MIPCDRGGKDNRIPATGDAVEAGIVTVIGFHVDDLVKKVIEPTGKEINGKPVMVTKYVETDIVSYDKDKKEYVVTTSDAPQAEAPKPECPTHEEPEAPADSEENNDLPFNNNDNQF